jgi:hypothetical protein
MALRRNPLWQHFDFGLSNLQNYVRIKFSSNLWCFVATAQSDTSFLPYFQNSSPSDLVKTVVQSYLFLAQTSPEVKIQTLSDTHNDLSSLLSFLSPYLFCSGHASCLLCVTHWCCLLSQGVKLAGPSVPLHLAASSHFLHVFLRNNLPWSTYITL